MELHTSTDTHHHQGRTAVDRRRPDREPLASYFEVDSLGISETVRTLTIVLAVCGSLTTLAGAMLGWWAARRALRPLALIGEAARKIADGRLETRLNAADYAEDAELGPLVSSFNEMVVALQERIDQDARFASDVSHELRSSLTTLTASVSVLRNAEDDLPKRRAKKCSTFWKPTSNVSPSSSRTCWKSVDTTQVRCAWKWTRPSCLSRCGRS